MGSTLRDKVSVHIYLFILFAVSGEHGNERSRIHKSVVFLI
jgi:hypothetical protein